MTLKSQKMEHTVSKAAISAISALQQKVRELEQERITLQTEIKSLQSQIDERNGQFSLREKELQQSTLRAKEMVTNSSITISQIQNAREENIKLKTKLNESLDLYKSLLKKKIKKPSSSKIQKMLKIVSEYEVLFGDIALQTTNIQKYPCDPYQLQQVISDPNLLPQPIRDVIKQLRKLPSNFKGQDINTKRAMVQGICCTRELMSRIIDRIQTLNNQPNTYSLRKNKYELQLLCVQLNALSHETNRFHFQ